LRPGGVNFINYQNQDIRKFLSLFQIHISKNDLIESVM